MPDLLLELFSEEIPAVMQAKAADDLKRLVTNALVEAGLTYAGAASFATPRRLTLTVEGLTAESPEKREERRGPRVDAPEKALEGFLRGAGIPKDQLTQREEKKGTFWFAEVVTPGQTAEAIIAQAVPQIIRNFPWPKSMRWGAGSLRWVRPLQRILCILTDEEGARVVPFEVDGFESGDITEGHRFMAPGAFVVTSFEDYTLKLKRAHVVIDPEERKAAIWQDATNMAFAAGLQVVEDQGLLNEVAGLVEWPVVLMGEIGADFLELPPEVLQTSMREHQKFFSVRNKDGKITRFITVANRETADNGATILAGNGKVLSARLADAKFFWENDLREAQSGMKTWAQSLEKVTFHNRLGSQAKRINRIASLAQTIAPKTGAEPALAEQAAQTAKLDLNSEMVYEFPELQGLMGRYYSEAAGLRVEVANACQNHYAPLGPSDAVPTEPVSIAVALADKIDLLTGFWAIDEKPTGSKDPFALRRAALGVIRLLLENNLRMNLTETFRSAEHDADAEDLMGFLHDRLKVLLKDKNISHDVIDACLAMPGADDLVLLVKRVEALDAGLKTEDGENLVQGYKRAANILTQAEQKDGVEYSFGADRKFAKDPTELALFDALEAADARIKPALEAEDFAAAMTATASLRAPVDAFFEAVQVNTDDGPVRRNRLNLLSTIRKTCGQVADLSRLQS